MNCEINRYLDLAFFALGLVISLLVVFKTKLAMKMLFLYMYNDDMYERYARFLRFAAAFMLFGLILGSANWVRGAC